MQFHGLNKDSFWFQAKRNSSWNFRLRLFTLASGAGFPTLARVMAWKRKITGGILAVVGFMLSPLSWWNDLFVNVPLALAFAWLVSLFYRPAFEVSLIAGYWLTNVLGFILMQKGAQTLSSEKPKGYSRRDLLRDVAISLL
ncbi:MAG: hypothetical protein DME25_20825, partial [Verrucomicrobia bacterium]